MKNFPKLSDAEIQLTISQPRIKLLLASLSYFIDLVNAKASIDCQNTPQLVKSLQQHVKSHYTFSLPFDLINKPDQLSEILIEILENDLQDPYFIKQGELQDMFKDEVNQMANQIDPDIFGLRDGENLELAFGGGVTCSPTITQREA